jgi:2-oxoglutarate ferredoxin oxidoreductase subunit gamma
MKLTRILMAGSGGQGIVFLGKLLANAALESAPHITFFPSYGAEVRGGDSSCQVILSPSEISSPVSREFDLMILMSPQGVEKFLPSLAPGGIAVVNSSLAPLQTAPNRILIPATQEADRLGDQRVANLIMLGALMARRPLVRTERIEMLLRDFMAGSPVILARNLAAFQCGIQFKG